jgi:hypothetical protein
MVGKRKAPDEKSKNEFTKRVQTRRSNMDEHELKIDNAKRADIAAIAYAVKKLNATQQFKDMSEVEKEERLQAKKEEVTLKR